MRKGRRKDRITRAARSALMGRIKSKNTRFETAIFAELRKRGIRFRKHYLAEIGNLDIALPKTKKAIFLHSDFWHGWRLPAWKKILPSDFWLQKLLRNRKRDKQVIRTLRRHGWKVIVIWEHQIRKNPVGVIKRAADFLKR